MHPLYVPYTIPEHQDTSCSLYQRGGRVHSIAQTHRASMQHSLYPKLLNEIQDSNE